MMVKNMKGMKKAAALALGMAMVFACQPLLHVSACGTDGVADGTEETVQTIASYDMMVGGTQTFELIGAEGGEVIVTVSELPSVGRVADGTYQISYTQKENWEAGYKIKVSNDRITSAYDEYCTVHWGSVSSEKLKIDSGFQASYTFEYKRFLSSVKNGVRSVLNGSKIDISAI